jgi:hypothetical protein
VDDGQLLLSGSARPYPAPHTAHDQFCSVSARMAVGSATHEAFAGQGNLQFVPLGNTVTLGNT